MFIKLFEANTSIILYIYISNIKKSFSDLGLTSYAQKISLTIQYIFHAPQSCHLLKFSSHELVIRSRKLIPSQRNIGP